ncbi:tRna binding domain-containing protein [Cardiosporidium cionae]|uniref:TRna binding domain-containing protein n=1 Tax=Cardiosporidium cionae TaxID=476202 RepID=A0ABQ7JBQ5_9APIC|nr:tRna binding domain-containing protein [Cardiosporidium cionae]|eukprot:KAF8821435.1 tRna binding domain-containing protein [Cardiosporidium cionae]
MHQTERELTQPLAILNHLSFILSSYESASSNEFREAEILQWLILSAEKSFCISNAATLYALNLHLENRAVIVGSSITVADITIFVSLFSWIKIAQAKERLSYCNIVRWFNYIQHLPGIENALPEIPVLSLLPKEQVPFLENNKKSLNQRGVKETEQGKFDLLGGVDLYELYYVFHYFHYAFKKAVVVERIKTFDAVAKKKKENSIKDPAPTVPDKQRPVDDITRLDIRVGVIKNVKRHPEAEKLYIEEIDIGEKESRQILSGLVGFIDEEFLLNKKCLVMANMKPKKFRGIFSHGMILCATSIDQNKIELLQPVESTPIGERVYWEGLVGEADAIMNTKTGKDPFVAVQPVWNTLWMR